MNAHELNKTIIQLIGKLIDRPISSVEIEYAPETYRFVIEELGRNFLHVDNETLECMLRTNAKMLMVICYEIIQTTAQEKRIKDIISNHTLVRQEVVPALQTDRAYERKRKKLDSQ
jgi:ethanolamine utilization protein EutA (predicted chaperonin)